MTSRLPGGWVAIVPWSESAELDVVGPRVALQKSSLQGRRWFVVAEADGAGSAAIPSAVAVAEYLDASALQVWSHLPAVRTLDAEFTEELALQSSATQLFAVRVSDAFTDAAELAVTGRLPVGIAPVALGQALRLPVRVKWLSAPSEKSTLTRVTLTLPRAMAGALAARSLGESPPQDWGTLNQPQLNERLRELTRVSGGSYAAPTVAELRVFTEGVLDPWLRKAAGPPSEWQAALAAQLGYNFARVAGVLDGWAIFEPESEGWHGGATLLRRRSVSSELGLCLGVPAPRWEAGVLETGIRLFAALNTQALVVHGSLANAASDGASDARSLRERRSYYQRMIEAWVNLGGHGVNLCGISEDEGGAASSILTLDRETRDLQQAPPWLSPLVQRLTEIGLPPVPFDGTGVSVAFEGTGDPVMAYSRSFAPGQLAILWLDPETRRLLRRGATRKGSVARLRRWTSLPPTSPMTWLEGLGGCESEPSLLRARACARLSAKSCRAAAAAELWGRYSKTGNPHLLPLAFAETRRCTWTAVLDPSTETAWVGVASRQGTRTTAMLLPLNEQAGRSAPVELSGVEEARWLLAMPLRPLEVRIR